MFLKAKNVIILTSFYFDSGNIYSVTKFSILSLRNAMNRFMFQQSWDLFEIWPNEKFQDAVDFSKKKKKNIFSDEVHFHIGGHINKQNFRFWGSENFYVILQKPMHALRVTAWFCAACELETNFSHISLRIRAEPALRPMEIFLYPLTRWKAQIRSQNENIKNISSTASLNRFIAKTMRVNKICMEKFLKNLSFAVDFQLQVNITERIQ